MPRGMSRGIGDRVMEGVPDLDGPGSSVLIWSSPERVLSVEGRRESSHMWRYARVFFKKNSHVSSGSVVA